MNDLEVNGHVHVRNFLSKDACKIVENYGFIEEQRALVYGDAFDDPQVHGSFSRYADSITESIMVFARNKVQEISGKELLPTYSYYRVYRLGAVLPPHTDRESCEISASLYLGGNYDSERYAWPLWVGGNPIYMSVGDMLVYKGIDVPHWRDRFICPDGSYHVQAFIHYVDANGPHSDFIYDKRESIFIKTPGGKS